jgi:transcriptional regulator with XRE-family HTH domain
MKNFGETVRDLRVAQDLGLRETAVKIGISPAYLSRIERAKERPPRPDVIKALAKALAADPDVLFRLSSSTDPEVVDYLHVQPDVMNLLRFIKEENFSGSDISKLMELADNIKKTKQSA